MASKEKAPLPDFAAKLPAMLDVYGRVMSGLLLLMGLFHWAVILGIGDATPSRFETMPMAAQGAVIWAAIIDPIAGVGLWLRAGWAVVLWLIATLTQVMLGAWAPAGMTRILIFTMAELALVGAYAVLSIKAAQESDAS